MILNNAVQATTDDCDIDDRLLLVICAREEKHDMRA